MCLFLPKDEVTHSIVEVLILKLLYDRQPGRA